MSIEIQEGLPERIKKFLQLDGEQSLSELFDLLRRFRNETHPDRYQDDEIKKKADDRLKDANALLDEAKKQMEIERFNRKPGDLVLYKPLDDVVELQNELDGTKTELLKIKNELDEANAKLKSEHENNEELNKQLEVKNDDSLTVEIRHLQEIYTPSPQKYASIGLAIILSGALGIMAQMEKVSVILEKYSPFGKQYISTILFLILVYFLTTLARKFWEQGYIKRKSEAICSPKYASNFMEFLKRNQGANTPVYEFSEADVFDFIAGKKHWFKNVVTWLGLDIFRPETTDRLKDIFLHNLLNKKLIKLSRAERMQRFFTIASERSNYDIWREHFQKYPA